MSKVNRELFEYIERKGDRGVTSREISEKFWITRSNARVTLSRYTNYRCPDGSVKRFLTYRPPPTGSKRGGKGRILGTYAIIPGTNDWWGLLYRPAV